MDTEKRIRQAAIRVVLEYGFDKTTMEDIAREAGVARSTIYTKWKTKEELFTAVLKREALKFADEWYRLVEADPLGGTFTGIYRNSLLAIRDNPFMKALYTQNRRLLGSFITQDQFTQLMNERTVWTATLFQMMQAEGLIRTDIDPTTAAHMAVTFRQGMLINDLSSDGESPAQYEQVIDLFTVMFREYMEAGSPPEAQPKGKQMLKAYVEKFKELYQ
jgi:AcrR family transcriptional regulator